MSISAIKTESNNFIYRPTLKGVGSYNGTRTPLVVKNADFSRIRSGYKWKLYNLFNTAISLIKTKWCGIRCADVTQIPENNDKHALITRLSMQKDLADGTVQDYCTFLETKNPQAQLVKNYLINTRKPMEPLPPRPEGKKQLLIPIVLREFPKDHIVAVLVTFDQNDRATIEFYDSKGLTIADRQNNKLSYFRNITLQQVIANIADHYSQNDISGERIIIRTPRVIENTQRDQFDCHNCGIYVCNYFEQRLAGKRTEEISETCNSFDKTFAMRREMIKNLINSPSQEVSSSQNAQLQQMVGKEEDDF